MLAWGRLEEDFCLLYVHRETEALVGERKRIQNCLKLTLWGGADAVVIRILELNQWGGGGLWPCLQPSQIKQPSVHSIDISTPSGNLSWIRWKKAEMKMEKRVGAMTHPCFTPVRTSKASPPVPPRTLAEMLSWRSLEVEMNFSGQPYLARILHSAPRLYHHKRLVGINGYWFHSISTKRHSNGL